LELSRIGRIANPPEDIPFDEVIRDTLELNAGSTEKVNIKIEIQKGLPTIRGDRTRLIEVMQNLISNAIKFMGDQASPMLKSAPPAWTKKAWLFFSHAITE